MANCLHLPLSGDISWQSPISPAEAATPTDAFYRHTARASATSVCSFNPLLFLIQTFVKHSCQQQSNGGISTLKYVLVRRFCTPNT
jgi:hypothetical protein